MNVLDKRLHEPSLISVGAAEIKTLETWQEGNVYIKAVRYNDKLIAFISRPPKANYDSQRLCSFEKEFLRLEGFRVWLAKEFPNARPLENWQTRLHERANKIEAERNERLSKGLCTNKAYKKYIGRTEK